MKYINTSLTTKTFYGVTFRPGEEHDVPGYINDPKFISSDKLSTSTKTTAVKSNKSSEQHKEGGKSDGTNSNK